MECPIFSYVNHLMILVCLTIKNSIEDTHLLIISSQWESLLGSSHHYLMVRY